MKTLVVALLCATLALGVTGALAQTGNAPTTTNPPASDPADTPGRPGAQAPGSSTAPAPPSGGAASPDVNVRIDGPRTPGDTSARDDGAALPRAAVERTTIFGLSPTAAIILAAALLVVIVLAIVAMTRTSDTYIDTHRP